MLIIDEKNSTSDFTSKRLRQAAFQLPNVLSRCIDSDKTEYSVKEPLE